MTGSIFTHVGKQVLANGHHYADAADVTAAECIVEALNGRNEHRRLRKAASDYFHATTDRTSRMAAPALRDALASHAPSPKRAEP